MIQELKAENFLISNLTVWLAEYWKLINAITERVVLFFFKAKLKILNVFFNLVSMMTLNTFSRTWSRVMSPSF